MGSPVKQLQGARARAQDRILATLPEVAFDPILSLSKHIFGAPLALIGLTHGEASWFRTVGGLEPVRLSLEDTFYRETVHQTQPLIVSDTLTDPRFRGSPWVTSPPFVRSYAGVSVTNPEGDSIGVLSVFDYVPRPDFIAYPALLRNLAALVGDALEQRLAAAKLEQRTLQTSAILDNIAQAFFTLDWAWRFSYLNARAETLLNRSSAELLGQTVWDVVAGSVSEEACEHHIETLKRGRPVRLEHTFSRVGWLEICAYPAGDGVAVYLQDINERRRNQQQAQIQTEFHRKLLSFTQQSLAAGLSERFYQELLENAVATIPGAQAGTLLVRKSQQHHFAAAVGYDLQALQACVLEEAEAAAYFHLDRFEPQRVYGWSGNEVIASETKRSILNGEGRATEIQVALCIPIEVRGQAAVTLYLDNFDTRSAFDSDATLMARILAQQAATLMQRLELEAALEAERSALARLAHYDSLTGLPNRYLFDEHLKLAVAQARRSGKLLAVFFIDLDRFKDINDSHGHRVGDALIAEVGARLNPLIREGDTLARWGGDEFIALFPELGDPGEAEGIAGRMLSHLNRSFHVEGLELEAYASIGIALYPDGSEGAEDIVKNADIALYEAKKQRGHYRLYSAHLKGEVRRRVELGKDLRTTLVSGGLSLHYQPRVRLTDGQVTSFEALARWAHPTLGFVPPSIFVPLAEELGLIRSLGSQVLEAACAQAKRWQRGGRPYRIAVNLSVEQLKDAQIVSDVRNVLARHELAAHWLELEVTESTAMSDVVGNISKLQGLRDLGVRLAIDDFGTAYSSLAYIEKLPVHSLKIDRSFLRDVASASGGETRVVEAVLALARSFDLEVIAEGVETEAQRQVLLELGCYEAQGYLFAAPMNVQETETFLNQRALEATGTP